MALVHVYNLWAILRWPKNCFSLIKYAVKYVVRLSTNISQVDDCRHYMKHSEMLALLFILISQIIN